MFGYFILTACVILTGCDTKINVDYYSEGRDENEETILINESDFKSDDEMKCLENAKKYHEIFNKTPGMYKAITYLKGLKFTNNSCYRLSNYKERRPEGIFQGIHLIEIYMDDSHEENYSIIERCISEDYG